MGGRGANSSIKNSTSKSNGKMGEGLQNEKHSVSGPMPSQSELEKYTETANLGTADKAAIRVGIKVAYKAGNIEAGQNNIDRRNRDYKKAINDDFKGNQKQVTEALKNLEKRKKEIDKYYKNWFKK